MPTYTSFAVVGAGGIGASIVEALLARKVDVLVLSRPSSSAKAVPQGAKVAAVDYSNDKAAVVAVLREHKVQVIVSALAGEGGLLAQTPLADAAKEAGVQLFAPSEFGIPSAGHTQGILAIKSKLGDHLQAIGLPSLLLYVGFFLDQLPWLTGLDATGKIYIVGKGNTPATFTAMSDVAGFLAYVLTALPPSQLANSVFRIQGVRASLLEVAARYGSNTPVVHVDAIPTDISQHEFKNMLQQALEAGFASTGWDVPGGKDVPEDAGKDNKLWEGHVWKGFKETLSI